LVINGFGLFLCRILQPGEFARHHLRAQAGFFQFGIRRLIDAVSVPILFSFVPASSRFQRVAGRFDGGSQLFCAGARLFERAGQFVDRA
jgi:hypothetical protein